MVDRSPFGGRSYSEGDHHDYAIELYETSRERERFDEQANLYAIILATEHLERAYARDAIEPKEYTTQCKKLISQFKLAERVIRNDMTTETFMQLYQMDCPRATERLLNIGVPEPVRGGADEANHVVTVAEAVSSFITAMDSVSLDQRAVDELQPLLSDLNDALFRLPDTPNDFEPSRKVSSWLQKLNTMRAVDELGDEEARQLKYDLDSAYTEFTKHLKGSTS